MTATATDAIRLAHWLNAGTAISASPSALRNASRDGYDGCEISLSFECQHGRFDPETGAWESEVRTWQLSVDETIALRDQLDAALTEVRLSDGELTAEQLAGVACVQCGKVTGPMTPVGFGPHGQLFAHGSCEAKRDDR